MVERESKRPLLARCSVNAVADAVGVPKAESSGGGGGTTDWSGLPGPAVHLVLMDLLPSLADAFSLGGVCRAWRSVFTACKRELFLAVSPLLVDRGSTHKNLGGFCSITGKRFQRRKQLIPCLYAVGASHGYWIAADFKCFKLSRYPFLMDPFSPGIPRIDLPQLPCGVPPGAFLTAPATSPDCVVVLPHKGGIMYCRPGDPVWVCHGCLTNIVSVDQMAILDGKLYCLSRKGKVEIVEELLLRRPRNTVMETKGLPPGRHSGVLVESDGDILYVADEGDLEADPCGVLVESDGDILYVADEGDLEADPCTCTQEHRIVVRRLDVPAREWVPLSTLGGRCLFINRSATSLALAAGAARWGGGGDRVYFSCLYSRDLLVFDMKDGKVERHEAPMPRYDGIDWLIPGFCYPTEPQRQ